MQKSPYLKLFISQLLLLNPRVLYTPIVIIVAISQSEARF